MKPLSKAVMSIFLFVGCLHSTEASTHLDKLTVKKWDTTEKMIFDNCEILYWEFSATDDRHDGSLNTLDVTCDDRHDGFINKSEGSLIGSRGQKYEALQVTAGKTFYLNGCYLTVSYFDSGSSPINSYFQVECHEIR